jgi:hemerythrin
MIAIWNDKYRTGHATVDSQHQRLFGMVNELHEAIVGGKAKEHLSKSLEALAKYCVEHFATEERLMTSQDYPGYVEHKRKHDELTSKATEIITGYQSGKLVLPVTLSQFLADWLRHHIGEEDQKLIGWIQTNVKR